MNVTNDQLDPKPSLFKRIRIPELKLFERSHSDEQDGFIIVESYHQDQYYYRKIDQMDTELFGHPIILTPDGSIWKDGSIFLLDIALSGETTDPTTLNSLASDLVDFMNKMMTINCDYENFNGRKFELPTYIYRSAFRRSTHKKTIGSETANKKIRSMVRFYTWKIENREFRPANPPWQVRFARIPYQDRFGYPKHKEVKTTDLIYPVNRTEPIGDYINDGGRLTPLDVNTQHALIDALMEIGNTEMLLGFVIALVTGMRIQTVFTLRCGDIVVTAGTGLQLIGIRAGGDSLTNTKKNKPQVILMPEWLHCKLAIYLESTRYKHRAEKAAQKPHQEQYVLLTRGGKPYYTGRDDRKSTYKYETGSAVRYFIEHTVKPKMVASGCEIGFSFHDLRATFGMNLLEERITMLNLGMINSLELLDYIRRRMNHSSAKTTEQYLNFRKDKQLNYEADSSFQSHLMHMIRSDVDDDE